jgi:hypothetical protein
VKDRQLKKFFFIFFLFFLHKKIKKMRLKELFDKPLSTRKTTNGGWMDSREVDWGFGQSDNKSKEIGLMNLFFFI